jgi:hypothetical protein
MYTVTLRIARLERVTTALLPEVARKKCSLTVAESLDQAVVAPTPCKWLVVLEHYQSERLFSTMVRLLASRAVPCVCKQLTGCVYCRRHGPKPEAAGNGSSI